MIKATIKSNISNRIITKSYTARQLLDFYAEDALVEDMSMCDCQPTGETNVVDCDCYDEWEDYTLTLEEMPAQLSQ